MQGRLSSPVAGRIQAFPVDDWQEEFSTAEKIGLELMEWTLDHEGLSANPFMSTSGRATIRELSARHGIHVPSVTGDCFMQAPFWKASGSVEADLQEEFLAVLAACRVLGVAAVVVPLVDDGAIETEEESRLLGFLTEVAAEFVGSGVRVLFESDLPPVDLARFIDRLDPEFFGVNYDIGNSASLGFDPTEEISAYGDRIGNVHVKDRSRGGTTVPLGEGDADFESVFRALGAVGYEGNYVLQTARASDGDHVAAVVRYSTMVAEWIDRHGA